MHQHYLMFQNDPPLINQSPIWKGPAPQMTKRDNSAFWIQQCTLNAILSKEFHWTGKQYMWRNEVFFNKTFLIRHSYKPLSSSPHSSTYRVAKTFLKQSVQKSVHLQKKSVQFSKKKSVQSLYFFLKIRTIFEKIPAIRAFKKNKSIIENIIPFKIHLSLQPEIKA